MSSQNILNKVIVMEKLTKLRSLRTLQNVMQGYYWRQNELKAGKGSVASCKMLLVDCKQTNFLSVSLQTSELTRWDGPAHFSSVSLDCSNSLGDWLEDSFSDEVIRLSMFSIGATFTPVGFWLLLQWNLFMLSSLTATSKPPIFMRRSERWSSKNFNSLGWIRSDIGQEQITLVLQWSVQGMFSSSTVASNKNLHLHAQISKSWRHCFSKSASFFKLLGDDFLALGCAFKLERSCILV